MPCLVFTPAAPGGAEALVALRIEAMRPSLERIGRIDPARARERFRAGFSPRHTRHVDAHGERVGFLVTRPQADSLLRDHLDIHPAHQGRGIGSAVLAQVFEEARALALPVRVGALRASDSNRFSLRHGFQEVGQGEHGIYDLRPASSP